MNRSTSCVAWRLRKRKGRGVYAASSWGNPKDVVKSAGPGPVQAAKRPEGRAASSMRCGRSPHTNRSAGQTCSCSLPRNRTRSNGMVTLPSASPTGRTASPSYVRPDTGSLSALDAARSWLEWLHEKSLHQKNSVVAPARCVRAFRLREERGEIHHRSQQ